MKLLLNTLSTLLFAITLLSGCSTADLQSGRLSSAETYLMESEKNLASGNKRSAAESLGTAKAYLGTLRDYKKYLTPSELKRYQALMQRANNLEKRTK